MDYWKDNRKKAIAITTIITHQEHGVSMALPTHWNSKEDWNISWEINFQRQ